MRKAPNQANRASGGHPGQNTGELVALDNPLAAQLLSSFETHYEAGRESRIVIQDVRPVQLSVTALGDPAHHLYEHLCALDYAGYHGPEPEWVVRDILEMRSSRRTAKPICQHMLLPDGLLNLLRWLSVSPRSHFA